MTKIYLSFCRRWGPRGGMTYSAYAWLVAQETGNTFWRDRIDGFYLLCFSQHNHCQSDYQKGRVL